MCSFHKNSAFASILPLLLIVIFSSTDQASSAYLYHICPNTTTYTPNSTYQANLNTLLSSFSSNATENKEFYNSTAGRLSPNIVYGLYLCRGDVASDVCRECVSTVREEIVSRCPKEKVAVIWYDECMLRYADQNIFSTVEEGSTVYMWNTKNITEPTRFNRLLGETMNDLRTKASNMQSSNSQFVKRFTTGSANSQFLKGFATGSSGTKFQFVKGFATESAKLSSLPTLYGLAQCTPDLSGSDCNRCLVGVISQLPRCCDGKQGGRVLIPSCNIRYETYPFYNSIATAPAPAPLPAITSPPPVLPPPTKGKGGLSSQAIIAIVAPICVLLLIFSIGYCYLIRKVRRKDVVSHEENVEDEITNVESLQFDLGTIEAATNNFSADNKIGEGGFGEVFQGVLTNGQEIAVKRLSKHSGQGAQEFKNEVVLVAKLQHRNLVRLLGFCLQGVEKILIYEYIPNKSLDCFLFDLERRRQLNWSKRYKIIGGIARGLMYLHEDSQLRIIHRDLKTSNILLDEDMNPKISDFGMAKIFVVDQTHGNTSRIVGTYGYMSPEYAMHGQFSVRSDVFSFGVMLLEIISGKRNTNFSDSDSAEDLLCYAWKQWKNSTPLELIDPTLQDSYSRNEAIRCINIGLLCVQEDVEARPSMASILMMLASYSVTMSLPEPPPFFFHSRTEFKSPEGFNSDQSTSKSVPLSVDEDSITGVYPR